MWHTHRTHAHMGRESVVKQLFRDFSSSALRTTQHTAQHSTHLDGRDGLALVPSVGGSARVNSSSFFVNSFEIKEQDEERWETFAMERTLAAT
jgi:hypothetical protein